MRTANPVFVQDVPIVDSAVDVMTVQGTVNKTFLLLSLVIFCAGFTWMRGLQFGFVAVQNWMFGGIIGGLILALVTTFNPRFSSWSAPTYAACEGLFLGGFSILFESVYPGIAFQAALLSFAALGGLLSLYSMGLLVVTDKFRSGLLIATAGIAGFYFLAFILSFFGISLLPFHGGALGIVFSVFVVGVAALNLVLDFDFVQRAVHANAPKYMEWYAGFGLLVTLIWLYVEMVRLLAQLRTLGTDE